MPEATGNLKDTVRNLGQTHQERPIIKMAPDTIVYIDGLPYLFNDFVGTNGTVFNINDFVTQASGAADLNTWVPSCTVNLSVPNDLKFLAMAPAGQRIIKTMSEIKIFTKGYYLTEAGDTVYHRIFWGVVTGVNYSDNRKTLEITLTCRGILHLFELMQINVAPSVVTAQAMGGEVTPFIAKWPQLNPMEVILHTFKYPLKQDVVDSDTLAQKNTWVPKDLFERAYVVKWNRHLLDMQKAVRLHGLATKKSSKTGSPKITDTPTTTAADPKDKDPGAGQGRQGTVVATKDEVERAQLLDYDIVAKFLPAYQLGAINLLQSTVTSRLTRIDEMVRLMGYEGYQDVDGSIVIKPPLYNLDTQNTDASPARNPFIIHLPEVLNTEVETEDESQVRMTRTTVKGTIAGQLLGDSGAKVIPEATYFDPALIHQFGLRTEPPKTIPLLAANGYATFGFAVAEQVKLNKNYRTYTVTIPMRPEIRLGFPIYVPHNDFYAYLENVSWSFVRGGQATMTLSCTNIRHREMFAKEKVTEVPVGKDGAKVQIKEWIYTSLPNLELKYTAKPADTQSINSKNQVTTNPVGAEMTQPSKDPKTQDPTPEQKELKARQEERLKLLTGTKEDTGGLSWRVSDGTGGFFTRPETGGKVNQTYYNVITRKAMPYTDEKGYNVIRPFPWGRYMKLEDALDMLTRPPERRTKKLLPHEAKAADKAPDAGKAPASGTDTMEVNGRLVPMVGATVTVVGTDTEPDAFLMTGLGTPSLTSTDPTKGTKADKMLMDKLYRFKESIDDDLTYFVVSFEGATAQGAGGSNPYSDGEQAGNNTSAGAVKGAGTPMPPADKGQDSAEANVYNISSDTVGPSEFSQ